MKHVIVHILSSEQIEQNWDSLLSFVSEERRKKTESYLSHEKQVESLGSGYFQRRYTDQKKKMKYTEYGKPYKDGEFFSVSHSHGFVTFVSMDVQCGLDMEKIRAVNEKMFSYVLSDEERNSFVSDEDFMKAWTRKEAIVKTKGGSIFSDIKRIPSTEGMVSFDGDSYFVSTYIHDGFVISVSCLGDEEFTLKITKEQISL